jgi:DNA-binding NarL/FixJ family response regulator
MATHARVALQQAEDIERILILGEDPLDLAHILEKVQRARVLHVSDSDSLRRHDLRDFDPHVVICSGKHFRRVITAQQTGQIIPSALSLTARRREMLRLIAKGLTNREVANIVGLSQRVVKSEVSALRSLFEVSNRTELATAVSQLLQQPL